MKTSIESPVEYKPSLHLDGKDAKHFIKHKVGAKVKFTVHGVKKSHSQSNMGKGMSHTVGIEISKIVPEEGEAHEKAESKKKEASEHNVA